jgi:hypothetical protein
MGNRLILCWPPSQLMASIVRPASKGISNRYSMVSSSDLCSPSVKGSSKQGREATLVEFLGDKSVPRAETAASASMNKNHNSNCMKWYTKIATQRLVSDWNMDRDGFQTRVIKCDSHEVISFSTVTRSFTEHL